MKPDLFLHLGDTFYADQLPSGKSLPDGFDVVGKARIDYGFWAAEPHFREFAEKVPLLAIWDDHDLGKNDAGADFPQRAQMEELFLDFFGVAVDDPRRKRTGVYFSRTLGPPGQRVQIILLDTRSFRTPLHEDTRPKEEIRASGSTGKYMPTANSVETLLGDKQWAWLNAQLKVDAEVRVLGSSIQVFGPNKGIESWANFPHERKRLLRLLEENRASGLVLLSGDVHYAEMSLFSEGPYPLYELTSSNLATNETDWGEEFNKKGRILGGFYKRNFGLLSIDWAGKDTKLTLSARDDQGSIAFERVVPLAELQFDRGISPPRADPSDPQAAPVKTGNP